MVGVKRGVWLLAGFLAFQAGAADQPAGADAETERIRSIVKEVLREYAAVMGDRQASGEARGVMQNILQDNRNFVRTHGPDYFSHFVDGQHPRATVVSCADSRVHTHALDATPDGDLFMIRNIGNQISTAEGSVDYGVHHLHTPILLVVGHSDCGAIKAASGDYSKESHPIQRELDTIQIPKGAGGINGVRTNVQNQVRYAMQKFEQEVLAGELMVIGAIYDFRNDLGQGQGKLTVINVNGETDLKKISKMDLMQISEPPASVGKSPRTPSKTKTH